MQPIAKVIRLTFIPAITSGYICSDNERKLFVLPIKFDGLGLVGYYCAYKILNIETREKKQKT